jgi:hypothetical protein
MFQLMRPRCRRRRPKTTATPALGKDPKLTLDVAPVDAARAPSAIVAIAATPR